MGAFKSRDSYTNLGETNLSQTSLDQTKTFKQRLNISEISRILNLEVKIPSSANNGDWLNSGWETMLNEDEFDTLISNQNTNQSINQNIDSNIDQNIGKMPSALHIDIFMNDVVFDSQHLTYDVSADYFLCYERGSELEDAGCYDEAVSYYQQALRLEPRLIPAWNRLGAIFSDYLQRYDEALACFNRALRLNYLDDLTWFNRANVLEMMECYEDAIASYDLAIKLNPDDEAAWYGRGWSQYCLGELNHAIASFEQVIELKPIDDSAWYNQACCYALQNNVSQAVACLRQAIKLSPNQYRHAIKTEADFAKIRPTAEFIELIKEIG